MYSNLIKKGLGGFADSIYGYWSSSEFSNEINYAWKQNFNNGHQTGGYRGDGYKVRPVRAF